MSQPALCLVYVYMQDILGSNIGSVQNAVFSVYGGSFRYDDHFITENNASSHFNSSGYAELLVTETQTPGIHLNFSISYQINNSIKQINFDPVIVPNAGSVNLATIATIKG